MKKQKQSIVYFLNPPKEFKIFGQTIKIKYKDTLVQESDQVGQAGFRTNEIILQRNGKNIFRPIEQMQQTYLHEVMHMIFNQIGECELRDNEKVVDLIANALHQVFTTSKY